MFSSAAERTGVPEICVSLTRGKTCAVPLSGRILGRERIGIRSQRKFTVNVKHEQN